MEYLLVLAFVLICVMLICKRPAVRETFVASCPQQVPESNFEGMLRLAADTGIPVRLGDAAPVPFKYTEVREAMTCAVALINTRCSTDLVLLGIDSAAKAQDAVKNVRYTADVHMYSQKYNLTLTCFVAVLTNGGRKYVQSVTPQTPADTGEDGVDPAPADVFVREYACVESLV